MHLYLDGISSGQIYLSNNLKRQFEHGLEIITGVPRIARIYDFNNETTLINYFNMILALPATNDKCTITICCHGHEHDGLIFHNEEERMSWERLRQYFCDFKQRFPNLVIILSVCHGAFIGTVNNVNPFVFGYTFKIPMQKAMDLAIEIIYEFYHDIALNQIRLNAALKLVSIL